MDGLICSVGSRLFFAYPVVCHWFNHDGCRCWGRLRGCYASNDTTAAVGSHRRWLGTARHFIPPSAATERIAPAGGSRRAVFRRRRGARRHAARRITLPSGQTALFLFLCIFLHGRGQLGPLITKRAVFIVLAMGQKPSPSGETFRLFGFFASRSLELHQRSSYQ